MRLNEMRKKKKDQQQQTEKTFGVKETLTVKSIIDLFTFERNDKENRATRSVD